MLTEIEWWGGLILIWLVISCRLMMHSANRKLVVHFYAMIIAFISAGVTMAFYFYSLSNAILAYVYISVLSVGILCLFMFFFWPDNLDDEQDEDDSTLSETILAYALILIPILTAFTLGSIKSYPIIFG